MATRQVEQPQEHLADGWEPGTPHTDSLCRTFLHHMAEQNTVLAASAGGNVVRTDRFLVADHGHEAGYFSGAALLGPPPDQDGLLDEPDPLLAGSTGNVLVRSLWPTPDLRRRGWSLMGHPPCCCARPPTSSRCRCPTASRGSCERPPSWRSGRTSRCAPVHSPHRGAAGSAWRGRPRSTTTVSPSASPMTTRAGRCRRTSSRTGSPRSPLRPPFPRPAAVNFGRGTRKRRCAPAPASGTRGSSDVSRPLAEAAGFVQLIQLTLWYRPRPAQEQQ